MSDKITVEVDLDWNRLRPVLFELMDEDWTFKFENDHDEHILEEISEDSCCLVHSIYKQVDYFKSNYRDIVKETRILVEPLRKKGVY